MRAAAAPRSANRRSISLFIAQIVVVTLPCQRRSALLCPALPLLCQVQVQVSLLVSVCLSRSLLRGPQDHVMHIIRVSHSSWRVCRLPETNCLAPSPSICALCLALSVIELDRNTIVSSKFAP